MQCKDIPDKPILERIHDINQAGNWCFRHWIDDGENDRCPLDAFPEGKDTPDKLVMAKMSRLFKRGLVTGCDCGCRGDYVITDAGAAYIGRAPQTGTVGY